MTDTVHGLPHWMRRTLLATAALNMVGALLMAPPTGGSLRPIVGLPEGHPLYMWIVAAFVLIFGAAYLSAGLTGQADTLFIAVGAAGKIAFSVALILFWLDGALPWKAPMLGSSDLVFGGLFCVWLCRRPTTA